jgi:hypothetical protein
MGLSTAERDRQRAARNAAPPRDGSVTAGERHRDETMMTSGSRWLLLGGILFVAGLIVTLIAEGLPDGIGVALFSFSTLATIVGAVLMVSSFIARRARAGKPFA